MAVNWNLRAVEILEKLGCMGTGGKEALEKFERENGVKLPRKLFDFLCAAQNSPLLATADIWTENKPNAPSLCFFYEEIDSMIASDREYWEKDPEDYKDNDYYQFFKIPREDWPKKVSDYLLIGSDFAAGVVEFGVRAEDLARDDPPVYMLHEADPITDWNLYSDSVSDFVMQVLIDVLCCTQYNTAQGVLKKAGWSVREFRAAMRRIRVCEPLEKGWELLKEKGAGLSGAKKYRSNYGADAYVRCGWDEDTQTLYAVMEDLECPDQGAVMVYSKA